jgi:SRSO17 transposase
MSSVLQQFVNQSPWDPMLVRRALARRMSRELTADAWVIDDTGFPTFGRMSVGVARQYSGALGKGGNCRRIIHSASHHDITEHY